MSRLLLPVPGGVEGVVVYDPAPWMVAQLRFYPRDKCRGFPKRDASAMVFLEELSYLTLELLQGFQSGYSDINSLHLALS